MFGTFINDNVNAGGSATFIRKHILPDHAIVTHEVSCQGRDHIVRIQSGDSVLVVINAHYVSEESLPMSQMMTTVLRLSPTLREPDGAIHRQMIMDASEDSEVKPWDGCSRIGRDAWNSSVTRSGSNTVLKFGAIHSTCQPFKDTPTKFNNDGQDRLSVSYWIIV